VLRSSTSAVVTHAQLSSSVPRYLQPSPCVLTLTSTERKLCQGSHQLQNSISTAVTLRCNRTRVLRTHCNTLQHRTVLYDHRTLLFVLPPARQSDKYEKRYNLKTETDCNSRNVQLHAVWPRTQKKAHLRTLSL